MIILLITCFGYYMVIVDLFVPLLYHEVQN
jgi:hypothetical protein